jgi:DNA-directed RNA polymerase I, II, and III subunit RPABC2
MAEEEHESHIGSDDESDHTYDINADVELDDSQEDNLTEDQCDYKILEHLDDSDVESESHYVDKSSIQTSQFITKYEKARVLGWRSQQITSGAPSMIRADEKITPDGDYIFENGKYPTDTYKIAEKELLYGRLPLIIGRLLPNGEKIRISVSKLKLI